MQSIWRCTASMALSLFLFSLVDAVRVYNVTERIMYVATYSKPIVGGGDIIRTCDPVAIDPFTFSYISRPTLSLQKKRYLAASENADLLTKAMPYHQFKQLYIKNIGSVFESFYLVPKNESFTLCDPVSLKLADFKDMLNQKIQAIFDGYSLSLINHSSLIMHDPCKNKIAHVRVGDQLCAKEQAYVSERMPHIQAALEKLIEKKMNGSYIPKIACINSGGGGRALISAIGFHSGAQEIGLLDTVLYDVGLSGGSWFIALWMRSGLDITSFKKMMQPIVAHDLRVDSVESARLCAESLMIRFGLRQPVTLVNAWGALLANTYLASYGDMAHQQRWSCVANTMCPLQMPFPILAATSGHMPETFESRPKVPWYEFTPYEVSGIGNWLGNVHVPMWAFGRRFKDGVSTDFTPELDLGTIMGICGSAFAFSFARGYDKMIKDVPVLGYCSEYIMSKMKENTLYTIGKKRFTVGKVHNFAYHITGADTASAEYATIVDAGISFNLPYPPVSGHSARSADVLIFFDASNGIEKGGPTNIYMAEKYAREHGLKFPRIDARRVAQSSISIFKDEADPTVPIVIYMPRIIDRVAVQYDEQYVPNDFSTAFKTSKFAYNASEYQALTSAIASNVIAHKNRIKEALSELIAQHGGFTE